jgi:signal transduction histidine kinase
VRVMLGLQIPSPYQPNPHYSILRRARAFATDPAVWRDLLYTLLLFPIGIVEFTLAVTLVGLSGGLIAMPIIAETSQSQIVSFTIDSWLEGIPFMLLGLLVAIPFAAFLNLIALAHRELARILLGPSRRDALQQRVNTLSRTRTSVVEAMLAERRRIERDLHDGVQQHLVHLAMSLGMAKDRIDTDPVGAKALVTEAHEEAKRTISDLRNTVRGIHPAVLTDRGLEAALASLTGTGPVPVDLETSIPQRPPPAIEAAAYFVVAEALANAAKHSGAERVRVRVVGFDDRLLIEVADDGRGGADPAGEGLVGLRRRVEALDGRLGVGGGPDGGTIVRAELPCGS